MNIFGYLRWRGDVPLALAPFNEADNLVYYDLDKSDRFEELSGLLSWASSDLERKNVFKDVRRRPSMH